MSEQSVDVEREKNESFEMGHISQLEDIAEDLRERAGKLYANKSRKDTDRAKHLKKLASEYEERAEKRREVWEEKYRDDPDA